VCAAAALLVAAGSAFAANPAKVRAKASRPVAHEKGLSMQVQRAGSRLQPLRMAKFTKVDGRIVLTTPWIDVSPNAGTPDTDLQPAFDCYEGDAASLPDPELPTNFLTCGSNAANFPGATQDSRWYSGQTAPAVTRVFNDMTLAPGFNGADGEQVAFAWNGPTGLNQTTVAVSTYEDYPSDCTFPAAPTFIDGVIFDFGLQTGGLGYFWTNININSGPTPLVVGLPADGAGAYEVEFFSDIAGTTLQTLAGTQPMYWGTGEDEPTPDGRKGTQDKFEFDDDVSPYGGAYASGAAPAGECYDLTAGPTQCPNIFGPMVKFWGKGGVCYPDCDASASLTVADFPCFQTKFVQGDPYADCDASGTLTVADFPCFQTKFVQGCAP
jgi:hypothetical protein